MNHLRNMLSTKRVKYISNRQGEVMIDVGPNNEETLNEVNGLISNNE